MSKPRNLIISNVISFVAFTILYLTKTPVCEVYLMHDFSFQITKSELLFQCAILFLGPVILLIYQEMYFGTIKSSTLISQFTIALLSNFAITYSLLKYCHVINGGMYMFLDTAMLFSFLLRGIGYIILCILLIKTFIQFLRSRNE